MAPGGPVQRQQQRQQNRQGQQQGLFYAAVDGGELFPLVCLNGHRVGPVTDKDLLGPVAAHQLPPGGGTVVAVGGLVLCRLPEGSLKLGVGKVGDGVVERCRRCLSIGPKIGPYPLQLPALPGHLFQVLDNGRRVPGEKAFQTILLLFVHGGRSFPSGRWVGRHTAGAVRAGGPR